MGTTYRIKSNWNLQLLLYFQDDKESKRERRKQSNRESARRSRLRKQVSQDALVKHAIYFFRKLFFISEQVL